MHRRLDTDQMESDDAVALGAQARTRAQSGPSGRSGSPGGWISSVTHAIGGVHELSYARRSPLRAAMISSTRKRPPHCGQVARISETPASDVGEAESCRVAGPGSAGGGA